MSVCLLCHISPLEHLFALKILPRTQQASEVKKICRVFSENAPLQRSRTPSRSIRTVSHFPTESARAH